MRQDIRQDRTTKTQVHKIKQDKTNTKNIREKKAKEDIEAKYTNLSCCFSLHGRNDSRTSETHTGEVE